jgi:hypothetical protein
MAQLLDAPICSLSLSQTSSDVQFGDRNLAVLHTDITDCWLRNEYSVQLIITKLEQVVMRWNAILFQLVYGLTIYRPVCLFLFIELRWKYNPVEFAIEVYQFQYVRGKSRPHIAASNYLYIYICICVGEFMQAVYLIFQTVLLE